MSIFELLENGHFNLCMISLNYATSSYKISIGGPLIGRFHEGGKQKWQEK